MTDHIVDVTEMISDPLSRLRAEVKAAENPRCSAKETLAMAKTATRLARAVVDEGTVEKLCRALHEELGSGDADAPLLAPYQSSWDTPEWKRWQQWMEPAQAVLTALASLALGEE